MQNVQKFFKKFLLKAEAFTFIHHETLAGLLNLWDLAAQIVSEQLLPRNLFGCLLDPVLVAFGAWSWGWRSRGRLFNAIDNPPTNPQPKLGYILAHVCSVLLQHVSKNLEMSKC